MNKLEHQNTAGLHRWLVVMQYDMCVCGLISLPRFAHTVNEPLYKLLIYGLKRFICAICICTCILNTAGSGSAMLATRYI